MKDLETLAKRRQKLKSRLAEVDDQIASELQRIQAEESRQMKAAAEVLGVSRQRLYGWKKRS